MDIFRESGLPDGVIYMVFGDPEMITDTIIENKIFLAFTLQDQQMSLEVSGKK